MAFIDRDGVIVSYANPADEALAFAVADRPHADGLHTRAAQTRIAIDFSTEIDFSQCEGWGCVDTCIDCTPTPLLTGHALALFKVGFTVAQAQAIASGACPVCFDRHGPKACAELRVELFREEVVEV